MMYRRRVPFVQGALEMFYNVVLFSTAPYIFVSNATRDVEYCGFTNGAHVVHKYFYEICCF